MIKENKRNQQVKKFTSMSEEQDGSVLIPEPNDGEKMEFTRNPNENIELMPESNEGERKGEERRQ